MNKYFLSILFSFSIFLPGHLVDGTVDRIFIVVLGFSSLLILLLNAKNVSLNLYNRSWIAILFLLQVIFQFGFMWQFVVSNPQTLRDAGEITRPILLFLIMLSMVVSNFDAKLIVANIMKTAMGYCVFVFIIMTSNFPILGKFFLDLYRDTKTGISSNPGEYNRFSIPFENPNYLAFFLIIFIFHTLFYEKKSMKLFWLIPSLYLMYLTGSRSGWIALFLLFYFFFKQNVQFLFAAKNLSKIFLSGVAIIVFLGFNYNSISDSFSQNYRIAVFINLFESNKSLLEEENISGRFDMASEGFRLFLNSPVVGLGGSKDLIDVIDNQYVTWLFRYGMLGIFLIGLLIFTMFITVKSTNLRFLFFALLFFLATGSFFDNFRLFYITAFYFTAYLSYSNATRVASNSTRAANKANNLSTV